MAPSMSQVKAYLSQFSVYYPDIEEWFDGAFKKAPRTVNILSRKGEVCGLSILKHGVVGKVCHISLVREHRGKLLGSKLMDLSLKQLCNTGSEKVIVTTPEIGRYAYFLDYFGFEAVAMIDDRYVPGVREVVWSVTKKELLDALADDEDGSLDDVSWGELSLDVLFSKRSES